MKCGTQTNSAFLKCYRKVEKTCKSIKILQVDIGPQDMSSQMSWKDIVLTVWQPQMFCVTENSSVVGISHDNDCKNACYVTENYDMLPKIQSRSKVVCVSTIFSWKSFRMIWFCSGLSDFYGT